MLESADLGLRAEILPSVDEVGLLIERDLLFTKSVNVIVPVSYVRSSEVIRDEIKGHRLMQWAINRLLDRKRFVSRLRNLDFTRSVVREIH